MPTFANPETIHAPVGRYSHSAKIPANAEWVATAGQVGMDRDGRVGNGIRQQADLAWHNVKACIEAHGMTKADIVKLTIYVTDRSYVPDVRAARDAIFGTDFAPISTLLVISGLVVPELLVEIEAWAARSA